MSKNLLIQKDEETVGSVDLEGEEPAKTVKNDQKKAILFANVFALASSIYQIGIKELQSQGMTFMDITIVRFTFVALLGYVILRANGKHIFSDIDRRTNLGKFLLRTIVGVFLFNLVVINTTLIPLALLSLLLLSSGFWASIGGYFLFGDTLRKVEVIGLIIAYAGIFLIIYSGLTVDLSSEEGSQYMLGIIIGIVLTILNALVMILTRMLYDVHFAVITFNYASIGIISTIGLMVIQFFRNGMEFSYNYTWQQITLLFTICFINSFSQVSYIAANQYGKAGIVTIFFQLQIFYNFLADIFIFQYSFTAVQLVGGSMLLASILTIGILKMSKSD